ncbi:ribosome-associated toxin RatA of RatAB toxin-antitoxin module [Kineococcus xinjiangensis]|uniref:Ribosome-associated toxin RatA of RatAB toxin-antitoxin module n=1 Tax=Kineococcus xinjiangensis TaxID=512762 RepID=A0A2S6IM91_9ACTN|nr:SRPBCC family protein [Kineococcus xinjiangensis]PPK95285.1 ribosome-associated toxin RatA of RatAB toxin-antitoxin module [Kineococcus xinjiangensis]
MAGRTQSTAVVAAAPQAVLATISDFEAYPQWASSVQECEVLGRDGHGRAERVRFVLAAGVLKDTYVLRYAWDVTAAGTGAVSWTLETATLVTALDGAYRLAPAAGGGTEVTHELAVALRLPLLGALKRKAEKTIIDTALRELGQRAGN